MPSISVIVPVYKVEAYLDRCVSSILRQSFRDFELILVDDGSPDNCGRLCDQWAEKDSRIHVIHQENGGLSAARNAGLDYVAANSNSSWIAFVDSDDWIHGEYLLLLYKAAAEAGSRISACGFCRTGGEELGTAVSGKAVAMTANEYYCSGTVHGGTTAVAWNKLYHRSLFRTLRYPVGKLHEDEFATYLAVYEAGTVGVVDDGLYAYFQNDQGIMRAKWNPGRLHRLEAFDRQIAYAQEKGLPDLKRKAAEESVFAIHDSLQAVEQLPQYRSYRAPLRRRLRAMLKTAGEMGLFPFEKRYYWVYEEAWPCKVFWWLLSKVR